MTLSWLTSKIEEYVKAFGEPEWIHINQVNMNALASDLRGFPMTGFLTLQINGYTVEAQTTVDGAVIGSRGSFCIYYVDSQVLPVAQVGCDCGASKTNQPGHSHWCSTQQKAGAWTT